MNPEDPLAGQPTPDGEGAPEAGDALQPEQSHDIGEALVRGVEAMLEERRQMLCPMPERFWAAALGGAPLTPDEEDHLRRCHHCQRFDREARGAVAEVLRRPRAPGTASPGSQKDAHTVPPSKWEHLLKWMKEVARAALEFGRENAAVLVLAVLLVATAAGSLALQSHSQARLDDALAELERTRAAIRIQAPTLDSSLRDLDRGREITARAANGRGPVWIYRDVPKPGAKDPRSPTERLFAPYGFMPEERVNQIAVNPRRPVDPDHAEKGTCTEYSFQFKGLTDWQGVYTLVGGNAWGNKRGIDVQKLLGLPDNAVVFCAFRARGEVGGETVTFQCGGVNNGAHPSSLRFPRILDEDPVTLKKDFRDYRIKLRAASLTNIIDPFCVVARALDNSRKDTITILVDDIRFETAAAAKGRTELPRGWRERLARTLFFDYTPTGYDPTAKPPRRPTPETIREDLQAVRRLADEAGLPRERAGVVLYGCRGGLEQIPALCHEAGLSAILGVWDARDKTEVQCTVDLLRDANLEHTVAAVCIGNEALTFRRATLAQLRQAAQQLRRARPVPVTTTEIVHMYGKKELFETFDFALPNVHALFNVGRPYDPEAGARWTAARIRDLRKEAPPGYLIVIKEVGWPSGPAPAFSEEGQAKFWRALLAQPVAAEVNICVFEASFGGAAWKKELIAVAGPEKANVGPFWSVLGPAPGRQPNPAGRIILGHARRLAPRPAP